MEIKNKMYKENLIITQCQYYIILKMVHSFYQNYITGFGYFNF